MSDPMHGIGRINGPLKVQPSSPEKSPRSGKVITPGFEQVLDKEVARNQEVHFSNHAVDRLRSRNIQLTTMEVKNLNGAVQRVAEKGGRDSLVLMNNIAFVVNVPSRTVVTAIDNENLRQNVFTQIDSAVIA